MPHELPSLTHLANWHDRLPRYAWAAQLADGKRVLDLGCGTADGAALLVAAGARQVVAVDPRAELVDEALRRHQDARLTVLHRPIDAHLTLEASDGDAALEADFDAQSTSVLLRAVVPAVHRATEDQRTTELDAVDVDEVVGDEADEDTGAAADADALAAPFDLILALDTRLPLGQPEFLDALAARLAPGGRIVAALRLDGTPTLGDVLDTLEHGRRAAVPVAPGLDGARRHLESVFGSVQFVAVRPRLVVSLEPPDAERRIEWRTTATDPDDNDGDDVITSLAVLAREGQDASTLPAAECVLDVGSVAASLSGSASALLARTLGSEHGTLMLEEQLSQKEALVDDLEREVRAADGRRREVEAQLVRLREELDELQGELTEPRAIAANAEPELQRALEDRERALAHIDEQRRHAEAVAARLHEAVEAQRVTIDALRTRLQLTPLGDGPSLPVELTGGVEEGTADVAGAAAGPELDEARARIASLERELERRANALDESRESAEEARKNLDEACTELSTLRRANESLAARERDGRTELEIALSSERERRAEVEHRAGEIERQLGEALTRLDELERAVESRDSERSALEKQLARFRRTRRTRRGAARDERNQVEDATHRRELESRDARIAELHGELDALRAQLAQSPREVIEIPSSLSPLDDTQADADGQTDAT